MIIVICFSYFNFSHNISTKHVFPDFNDSPDDFNEGTESTRVTQVIQVKGQMIEMIKEDGD